MEKSSFFNSVNGDRKYDTKDWAAYFNTFITNGIFPNPSTNLQVMAGDGMNVIVKAGSAWINGYCYKNTSDLTLSIEAADGVLNRIDRIVIRLDTIGRQITAVVKKGTFASSPVAPTLQRDADVYELGIADISIAKGTVSISQANISDLRLNTSLCGVVNSLIQVDTETLFAEYEAGMKQKTDDFTSDFLTWFQGIQGVLSGDVAGNLLNLINTHKNDKNNPHEVTASQVGAETPTGAQAKADAAQTAAINALNTHKNDYVAQPANGGTTSGSSTGYTCTSSPNPTAFTDKMGVVITAHVDSGANPTLAWGTLAAKAIKKPNGNAALLKKDGVYTLRYNATTGNFILQGEGGSGNSVASDLRLGKTASTDAGDIVGTLDLSQAIPSNIKKGVTIDGQAGTALVLGGIDTVNDFNLSYPVNLPICKGQYNAYICNIYDKKAILNYTSLNTDYLGLFDITNIFSPVLIKQISLTGLGSSAMTDDYILIQSNAGVINLYTADANIANIAGPITTGAWSYIRPAVDNTGWYCHENGYITKRNLTTLAQIWRAGAPFTVNATYGMQILQNDTHVFFLHLTTTMSLSVEKINKSTGAVDATWTMPTGSGFYAQPLLVDGNYLYVHYVSSGSTPMDAQINITTMTTANTVASNTVIGGYALPLGKNKDKIYAVGCSNGNPASLSKNVYNLSMVDVSASEPMMPLETHAVMGVTSHFGKNNKLLIHCDPYTANDDRSYFKIVTTKI